MTTDARWPFPGARWWKFDFHAHTPASLDTEWALQARRTSGAVALTPEDWLLRYMKAEVDCVAITDHNTTDWIDRLKVAYEGMRRAGSPGFRELHIFPGIEISVQGPFHLLVLFDPSSSGHDVASAFGVANYAGTPGDSDATTETSAIQIVRAMTRSGGLAIPAHVDAAKGLLKTKNGDHARPEIDRSVIEQLLKCDDILAVEVVDRNRPRPSVARDHTWTEVLGADSHGKPGIKEPGTRFTWVKMPTPSINGLRLALSEGAPSVRRSDEPGPFDPFATPEHLILGLEMAGGRVFGRVTPVVFGFSPWLNAIVGGRGTGKSSAVHALRLACAREGDLDHLGRDSDPARTFRGFRQVPKTESGVGALQAGTSFSVTVRRGAKTHRIDWRRNERGEEIREVRDQDDLGGWSNSTSPAVTAERFPLRIFSQGQIAGLAGDDPAALLALIDETAGVASLRGALREASERYLALCSGERELRGKLAARDLLTIREADVRGKLASFEGMQHADTLRGFDLRTRQRADFSGHVEQARQRAEAFAAMSGGGTLPALDEALFAPGDAASDVLRSAAARLAEAVGSCNAELVRLSERLRDAAAAAEQSLSSGDWAVASASAQDRYRELVARLESTGISDPREYEKLVAERELQRGERARLERVEAECARQAQLAAEQLAEVRAARRAISVRRREFLSDVLGDNKHVKIVLRERGQDERAVETAIRDILGIPDTYADDICPVDGKPRDGALVPSLIDDLSTHDGDVAAEADRRVDALVERIRAASRGTSNFGTRFQQALIRAAGQRPELLDRLACWASDDGLDVRYSESGDGKNMRAIGQASAGQRAAAMLAFLLANGNEPLILDQPEDDLDNLLIYDLVVKQLREGKMRRQVIVVTHNPNIVVNGDAEMVHALECPKGQCQVGTSGSLQDPKMREEICRIMEGGREAFRRRYRRLGEPST